MRKNLGPLMQQRRDELRKLQARGFTIPEAAKELGISSSYISILVPNTASRRWHHKGQKWDAIVQFIETSGIRDAREIAKRFATTPNSVYVMLWRKDLHKLLLPHAQRSGRLMPFRVPQDRRDEYRELRALGLTVEEAGVEMGLLEREALPATPKVTRYAGKDCT